MSQINSLARQMESEWAPELAQHFGRRIDEVLKEVRLWFEFPHRPLRIELMDSSTVQLFWAFHIVSENKRAIAVLTEHCRYHVFPYDDAKVYRDERIVYEQAV